MERKASRVAASARLKIGVVAKRVAARGRQKGSKARVFGWVASCRYWNGYLASHPAAGWARCL